MNTVEVGLCPSTVEPIFIPAGMFDKIVDNFVYKNSTKGK
jgi:hypothetical protein